MRLQCRLAKPNLKLTLWTFTALAKGGRTMKALLQMAVAFAITFLLFATATEIAQTPLTNDAVIKMVKAGLAEDVILNMINVQPAQFSITPDAMIALKKDGVSDKIIGAKDQPTRSCWFNCAERREFSTFRSCCSRRYGESRYRRLFQKER